MAAYLPSGSAAEAGFTYLGVLLLIAVTSIALSATVTLWSTQSMRERERDLLWVGSQYAQALRSYYRDSPGLAQYPQTLDELLEDPRYPNLKRHLRRLYPDPITGSDDWGLLRSIDGRITGVYSRSEQAPMKQAGFAAQWSDFEGLQHYSDWQFVAEKAFSESAAGARKGLSQGAGE
ncbi:type II secretion system protein [Pseudomonas sp. P66]|jgi:type II secretory pathway pseudopilin PulG|uniref:Type II secretion system protein n=1 Tax=Pseudomonas arcuscaelestis TaxID=2710591 RepID=A0ABS2BUD6_9PSED|nr:type II secretion system protein [Pseudomonas arcuscaelestis]MBM3104332.1 type II secretion system protein [Pseudomonas arcuscaelestis]MBM3113705.1 type II secretion system protein [Pseudomonas arcuscaelestis]MBM5457090.1 type II secretion system protein [Pseudomonas arcuscaelestis]